MDERRFDAALRALNAGTTRRRGLAAAAGVRLGRGVATASAASRGKKPKPEGPCGDGSAAANRCTKNSQCCTKYCAEDMCRCKPNYMSCGNDAHCCSGLCVNGRCDGGCKPEGTRCEENFNCCSGLACVESRCASSNKAKCSKSNCAGCCDGTVCRAGSRQGACGASGAACAACGAGKTCTASGVCAGLCGECSSLTPVTCSGTCTASANWTNQSTIGSAANPTAGPGVAITANGLMALTGNTPVSPNPSLIQIWTRTSATATAWTVATSLSGANSPNSFALSPDNLTFWATDSAADMVYVYTRPSTSSTAWTKQTEFSVFSTNQVAPQGIAVSPDGLAIWIVDYFGGAVQIWSRSSATSTTWTLQTTFGADGSGDAQLKSPHGVAVSPDMLTVWVGDTGNNRVSVWTRPSTSSTAWSHAYNVGSPGAAPNQFTSPNGVAISCDTLTLYVGDSGNSRVSIWTRPNVASATWSPANTTAITGLLASVAVTPDGRTLITNDLRYPDQAASRAKVWTLGC